MGVKLTSLIWGFAEATFFFIVPDVLLTLIALKNWRLATRACLWSLGGALIGGVHHVHLGRIRALFSEGVSGACPGDGQ